MVSKLLIAWSLMAGCVVIHATGMAWAMPWLHRRVAATERFQHWMRLFIGLAGWIVALHVIEITLWALFYMWKDAMPEMQSALYFSAVTYTTTGYGDLVLPKEWQLVGAIEALTGILMCGWSTGFFFAAVSHMFRADTRKAESTT